MPFGHGYPSEFTTAFFHHPMFSSHDNMYPTVFRVFEGGVVIFDGLISLNGEMKRVPLEDRDIENPKFIEALKTAMHFQRDCLPGREGSYDNQGQPMSGPSNPFTFQFRGPGANASEDNHHIHITYLEGAWLRKPLLNKHIQYIPVAMHDRLVKEAEDRVRLDIQSIVQEQVEKGVQGGVSRAIQESTATLKQVENKKRELEKELERLEKLEAKLQVREAEKAAKQNQRQPQSRAGYVYLLGALHDPTLFKIGRTANPNNRAKTFGVQLPFAVEYVHLIQCEDMYALERELHTRFADKRQGGEFFALDDADVAYIKSLAG